MAAQEQTWSGGMAFQMALVARAAISHMNALFGRREGGGSEGTGQERRGWLRAAAGDGGEHALFTTAASTVSQVAK